jgi:ATP-dependent Lhr-like helicase
MAFARFHPVVREWFRTAVGEPTDAQLRGWSAAAEGRHTLIAAPTGSGKTLAAFLAAINTLVEDAQRRPLPDEVRVVYVSPLKALSTDIHKNLVEPRAGIQRLAEAAGLPGPTITAAVRTGDTSPAERAAMVRTPPHILVTTPESLYLLLTAERSREMLRTVRTVIVDEIHAVIGGRRGAHLALSLERLAAIAAQPLQRIGLSATQTPIEEVAGFLTAGDTARCTIVDVGHRRHLDLGVELPGSALDAVMANEVWSEYYDRLATLIRGHRTTLIFVNTRRLAERLARHLSERLGEDLVTAHHGSLSKEKRLDAETRLKAGRLRALVATASLELGIDIGHVDLVCQMGSPHRIATLLQRVGRSGHTLSGTPKGRVFPVSRDDLVECAALLRAVRQGELDAIVTHDAPLDVLAQQIVAECGCQEWREDDLYALMTRAWPYRALDRAAFDAVVAMMADGVATRRGRRAALLHRDEVNGNVRSRRGARLLAQTSGGAIPEIADYRVVLEPDDTFIGTLNEDFAIESNAGDIIQLGNASWLILQVAGGDVRVADAKGAPPTIPFWLGEAPARSDELSRAVSDLRHAVECRLDEPSAPAATVEWLMAETGLGRDGAEQTIEYLADGRRALGVVPTQQTLVVERFFDESGGMQLVLHAPFGSRINRAWGLALRKRFCRQFNFELQAAATEDALMLSLGPQHSFPLSDVFRYLHPETARDMLVQAFLDAPVFKTRWRWNTTVSLAVPRARGSRKVPPQIQRMLADDLMAAVFPDAAACLENIPGDRQIPDHPLVAQTVRDCLEEAMDIAGLRTVLERIHRGELRLVARDTPEPSVFAHDILNARPYAFLDDAPLEERRSHAVQSRRPSDRASADDLGALDAAAIATVRDEARPDPRDADELHDTLLTAGFLTSADLVDLEPDRLATLVAARRAGVVTLAPSTAAPAREIIVAAERLPEFRAMHPGLAAPADLTPPASRLARTWTRAEALAEVLRDRLTIAGPVTAAAMADALAVSTDDVDQALLDLEARGVVLRGRFTPGVSGLEWCDRSLLARIHRYTVRRLRAEIAPVSALDFMRFLFRWQHVEPSTRLTGLEGLREVVAQLDGFELAAAAWERAVLPARLDRYEPGLLDVICLSGEAGWIRLSPPLLEPGQTVGLVPATPIALVLPEHVEAWRALRPASGEPAVPDAARAVLALLQSRGATFFRDLSAASGLDAEQLSHALGALVASGLAASDGFAGLRALIWAASGRPVHHDRRRALAGRWTALPAAAADASLREEAIELQAWTVLRRYGVVFRRLLTRETNAATWRELCHVYRRLEARGEIRGGRFVTGMSGEQYALPQAVEELREARRLPADGRLLIVSAADPLNLAGIVTAGERVRAASRRRVVYRDGAPLAVADGAGVRPLAPLDGGLVGEIARALARGRAPARVA